MNDDQFAFFQRLVETTGPSGYEAATQRVWRERVEGVASSVKIDSMGNCMAVLNPSGSPRVMLEAHIDEIGFIVKYIDDDGYIYFDPIGGFDSSTLPGNRVRIMGQGGPVTGVIGRKPIHLISPDERKKAPEMKQLFIDIGVKSREEAQALVEIGDAMGRKSGMDRLQGSMVTSNSLDDRAGTYVVAEAFRALAGYQGGYAVFAASSTQEEIGLRGAVVTSYDIDAEIGIAVDVTYTSDHPHAPKNELGDVRVGGGPVLSRGSNTNPHIFRRLVEAAKAEGVPFQVDADARGAGTDQHVMQISRSGMATGLISLPTRYLHTASEMLSTDDLDAAVTIMVRFVRDLPQKIDLAPQP